MFMMCTRGELNLESSLEPRCRPHNQIMIRATAHRLAHVAQSAPPAISNGSVNNPEPLPLWARTWHAAAPAISLTYRRLT
ncbi:hypothetical protein K458DRAFT_146469 [Lentithecium fluviatile CBS 122367]|uniref:Uncharacterized protein n=1 Tax=Lentithecium fluviatile CBS 122367 TaxID=1168545 RepID=A0A6G1JCM0_9PLEO|nr:hypothetical protein K458DRAFT_146469 [Lentithecium fluviatile CBS 122367]